MSVMPHVINIRGAILAARNAYPSGTGWDGTFASLDWLATRAEQAEKEPRLVAELKNENKRLEDENYRLRDHTSRLLTDNARLVMDLTEERERVTRLRAILVPPQIEGPVTYPEAEEETGMTPEQEEEHRKVVQRISEQFGFPIPTWAPRMPE